MSAPDLLERTRMALAEVGYDPSHVHPIPGGGLSIKTTIPALDRWRAASIAVGNSPRNFCYACIPGRSGDVTKTKSVASACLADRPLVRDCGVAR